MSYHCGRDSKDTHTYNCNKNNIIHMYHTSKCEIKSSDTGKKRFWKCHVCSLYRITKSPMSQYNKLLALVPKIANSRKIGNL